MIDMCNTWRVRSMLFHRIVPGRQIFVTNGEIRWDIVLIELAVFSVYADVSSINFAM
jgi:hypothetical protein